MKPIIAIPFIILLNFGLVSSHAQMTASGNMVDEASSCKSWMEVQVSRPESASDSSGSSVLHAGFGFGYMLKGGYFSIDSKYINPTGWGISLDFNFGANKTPDLPSDYYPLIYPRDKKTIISLYLVRVLTRQGQNPRLSLEIGPSYNIFNNAKISPNPYYDPEDIFHLSRYIKTRDIERVSGVSIKTEIEIVLASFCALNFSVFVNFNKASDFMGIGVGVNFGDATY